MPYAIWIPLLAAVLALNAWFSVKNQQVGGWYFYATWFPLIGLVWAMISKHSKSIVVDYVIFDIELLVVFTFSLATYTNSWSKFNWVQYLGLGVILFGLLLFKKGSP